MRPGVAGRILTLTTALVAALAAPLSTAQATPFDSTSRPASAPAPVRDTHHVTLITGDVVTLTIRADGTEQAALSAPGPAASGYHQYNRGSDAYLVPSSARALVADGTLDRELFNISALVRQGLDDAHTGALPLILGYPNAGHTLARTAAPDGSRTRAVLPATHGLAVTESKRAAAGFWTDITGTTSRAAPILPELAHGIGHVWLDARVHATLDQSVPQIGGPAAWARGFDGTGVTVAVLDTGIDPNHPDFAGRITATADFTGGDDAVDHAGHGTHVASIVAGSGAASDGRYRGVAPAAHLMVGKVLGDDGSGSESAVIAGMRWAASHGADIVNLSLGGPVTRGNDPLSQAVDRLSERYGTLFVVAAGNHSVFAPDSDAVTAPAAADDALAVGSVDERDRVANNSRGGRLGNTAIKPELVAPGVRITAARAAGTGSGPDPNYATYSGTSMAAPHAAGAAALLKQEHPDWSFTRLKAALTSTATPLAGVSVVDAGAGRVDVDRATGQQVFVDQGTVDLGYLARPYDPDLVHQQHTVRYRNASTEPVTLHLSTTLAGRRGTPTPTDALSVSPATLAIAPGESAEATVRLDASTIAPDTYTGRVIADGGAGLRIGTTVGFYKQGDTVDISIRALDRNGSPAIATLRLTAYKKGNAAPYFPEFFHLGANAAEQVIRVPEGDYNLWALILTPDASGRFVEEKTVMVLPRVRAHPPNPTIMLDARRARPVSLDTPHPTVIRSFAMSWFRGSPDSPLHSFDSFGVMVGDGAPERVSVAGTERVDDAPFMVTTAFDAAPPVLVTRFGGRTLDTVWEAGPPIDQRHLRLPVADAGGASPAELEGRSFANQVALVRETPGVSYQDQVDAVIGHGARVVMLYSSQPGVFWPIVGGTRTVLAIPKDQGDTLHQRLAHGRRVTLRFDGQPNAPYAYDVAFTELGKVPDRLAYRVRQSQVATVRARLHSTGTHERGYRLHNFVYTECGCGTTLVSDAVPSVGHTRVEYVTARPDIRVVPLWQYRFDLLGQIVHPRKAPTFRPRQRATADWFKAPFSPGPANASYHPGAQRHDAERFGDTIHFDIAGWTDSAGHWTPLMDSTKPSIRLYHGDTLLSSSEFVLRGNARVSADPATYRLEAEVDHDGSLFGLSTHTSSTWTFHSAHSEGSTVLPLVDVDYTDVLDRHGRDLLDLDNRAPGDSWATLVLHADHQLGAQAPEVNTMDVSVSFDDGRTWQPTQIRRGRHGEFRASYLHPRTGQDGGYVSIRVAASDPAGNALEQTLIRAYRLSRSAGR